MKSNTHFMDNMSSNVKASSGSGQKQEIKFGVAEIRSCSGMYSYAITDDVV